MQTIKKFLSDGRVLTQLAIKTETPNKEKYSQCSIIRAFTGIIPDVGANAIRNQKYEKKNMRFLLNERTANIKKINKRRKPNKTPGWKKYVNTGMVLSIYNG